MEILGTIFFVVFMAVIIIVLGVCTFAPFLMAGKMNDDERRQMKELLSSTPSGAILAASVATIPGEECSATASLCQDCPGIDSTGSRGFCEGEHDDDHGSKRVTAARAYLAARGIEA